MVYTTLAKVRALAGLVNETSAYPDAEIEAAILLTKVIIDDYTGTSFEYDTATIVLDGTGSTAIWTGVADLRTVTSATINGDAVSDVSGWKVHPGKGKIVRDTGVFTWDKQGQNVSIVVTAGATSTVPGDILYAANHLTRWFTMRPHSGTDENVLTTQNEWGTTRYAQPDGKFGPTSLPEVNAILRRRRSRPPAIGAVF